MTRYAVALALGGVLAGAPGVAAQQVLQPAPGPQTAAPTTQQAPVVLERPNANETREQLQQLLRNHPPAVGEILRRDPSLARPDYLAPYPALVAFLQQHPEIARNPSFFFGAFEFQQREPRDRSYQMFDSVVSGFGFLIIFGSVLATLVWLIRTFIDQRRWLRVARTQAEVHAKVLDRLNNNEDLLTYIQTSAGRRFLESGPLMTEAEPSRPAGAPLSRIIVAVQAGVVLTFLGIGFWISRSGFPSEMGEGFFILGTLAMALGLGFAVSGAVAYMISSRFGLLTAQPPATTHD